MKCKLMVCCHLVITDMNNKRSSAIHILEDFRVSNFPFVLPLNILSIWGRETINDVDNNIDIIASMGETELLRTRLNLSFAPEVNTTKNVLFIGGIVINSPGILKIYCSDGETTFSSYNTTIYSETVPVRA